jgi:hypothetical protein
MFGASKNDIDFLKKIPKKILVKSPYYEKGKKKRKRK